MRKAWSHLTYANVMSTLAVVLVIGGGAAYAANTIGSADIIDGSIVSAGRQERQVAGDDLAANAVRTAKVLDESLTGHDIEDNTIGGADVNETLLNPLTSRADQGRVADRPRHPGRHDRRRRRQRVTARSADRGADSRTSR